MKLEDLIRMLNSFSIGSIMVVHICYEDSEGNERNFNIIIDE